MPQMVDVVRPLGVVVLLAIAFIDVRQRVVYWFIVGPAVGAAVLVGPAGVASAAIGLLVAASLFGALYLLGRRLYGGSEGGEPLGLGDVGIAALVGALAGFPGAPLALVVGSVSAGLVATGALLTRRARLDSYLPYGPGLCLGGVVALCLIPSA